MSEALPYISVIFDVDMTLLQAVQETLARKLGHHFDMEDKMAIRKAIVWSLTMFTKNITLGVLGAAWD